MGVAPPPFADRNVHQVDGRRFTTSRFRKSGPERDASRANAGFQFPLTQAVPNAVLMSV